MTTQIMNNYGIELLQPVRQWLENIKIHNPKIAKIICKLIPSQCPFARDIKFFDHTFLHIPPLCKLNPLYDQFVGLRFKALCYLADECNENMAALI